MNKTILTYGLISGAVGVVCMVAMAIYLNNAKDYNNGHLFGYAGILLSMLFVYFGTRTYRDQVEGSTWNFASAFKVSILIMLISCVCYVIAWMVVYQTLMPDFMDKYVEHVLTQLKDSGATAEKIAEKTAELEKGKAMYQNPFIRAAFTFIEPLPVGLPVTLLTSFVLRRKSG